MTRRRRNPPDFTVEFATLPERTPRRLKRKAKHEAQISRRRENYSDDESGAERGEPRANLPEVGEPARPNGASTSHLPPAPQTGPTATRFEREALEDAPRLRLTKWH